mmetsp:Transcript_6376/g.12338  ORF Transcript_6376/g.12338 Transcript_6376/m.12338 type:complete len:213 (-) Transcript_6376:545-1183(-)
MRYAAHVVQPPLDVLVRSLCGLGLRPPLLLIPSLLNVASDNVYHIRSVVVHQAALDPLLLSNHALQPVLDALALLGPQERLRPPIMAPRGPRRVTRRQQRLAQLLVPPLRGALHIRVVDGERLPLDQVPQHPLDTCPVLVGDQVEDRVRLDRRQGDAPLLQHPVPALRHTAEVQARALVRRVRVRRRNHDPERVLHVLDAGVEEGDEGEEVD